MQQDKHFTSLQYCTTNIYPLPTQYPYTPPIDHCFRPAACITPTLPPYSLEAGREVGEKRVPRDRTRLLHILTSPISHNGSRKPVRQLSIL